MALATRISGSSRFARTALAVAVLGGCASEPPELTFQRSADECEVDADCDDGLACNGEEHCGAVSHRCVAAESLPCDDGIACTVDTCEEPHGTCAARADDSLCAPGNTCVPDLGCVAACAEPPAAACDAYERCGCLEGMGCYLDPTGASYCADAGTVGVAESCANTDEEECAPGLACLAFDLSQDPARVNHCRTLCVDDADCPGDGRCEILLEGTALRACSEGCNVFDQSGCVDPDTGCTIYGFDGGPWFTDCFAAGTVSRGDACTDTDDCVAGTFCVTLDDTPLRCLGFCHDQSDCLESERCYWFTNESNVLDGDRFGPCVPR